MSADRRPSGPATEQARPDPVVGVLALQGAYAEHRSVLGRLGVDTVEVRRPSELTDVDALVMPGGESTTMSMLLDSSELREPLAERLAAGMPAFGTCAGMILLAHEVLDGRPDQRSFDRIDLVVRRNGYGRQLASFEADLELARPIGIEPTAIDEPDRPFRAVFIRAPLVEKAGDDVEVLATAPGPDGRLRPVLCRSGPVLVSAFHPELADDDRVHRVFVDLVGHTVARSSGEVS